MSLELQNKVLELKELILSKHPRMPTLLREIHTTLLAQPENVTLATEEEIQIVVSGLKIQTGVEFVSASLTPKGTKSTNDRIKKLGLGAF